MTDIRIIVPLGVRNPSPSSIEWPAQDAWPGVIPSVRNRNPSTGTISAGRGFGSGGADGAVGRNCYSSFNIGTQVGTTPDIYHVTNRNSSGAGSLQQVWDQETGFRMAVFDVAGRFPITSNNFVDSGGLWIAGQTAPGDVLIDHTVVGKSLRIRAGDVFMQHIILWHSALPEFPGQDAGNNDNTLIVSPDGANPDFSNLLMDHCMFGGGTDQVMLLNDGVDNVTIVDSLICCPRGKDPEETQGANFHQYNMTIGGNSASEDANFVSMIGCVFIDGDLRNPQAIIENASFVNCLSYNRDGLGITLRGKDTEDMNHKLNVIGCIDRRGADFGGNAHVVSIGRGDGTQDFGVGSELHVDDCTDNVTTVTDSWDSVNDPNNQESAVRSNVIVTAGYPVGLKAAVVSTLSVADQLTLILQNNGPRPNARVTDVQDIYDRIINDTGQRETDYAAPTVSNTSGAYTEPGSPHTEGVESGRSVIMEDILKKGEDLYV